jgi:hypothetical protein
MLRGNPVSFEKAWATFIAWVEAVTADTSSSTQRAKVIRNKPDQANDGCWSSPTQFIAEPQTFGILPNTRCNALFPSYAFPRYVAGSPLAADIIKCQLKPIDSKDYQIELTSEQRTRLSKIFPQGVCDGSKSGVEQRSVKPWASFGPSHANYVPSSWLLGSGNTALKNTGSSGEVSSENRPTILLAVSGRTYADKILPSVVARKMTVGNP